MGISSLIRSQDATQSHYQRARTIPSQPLCERLAAQGVRLTAKRRILLRILEEADLQTEGFQIETARLEMGGYCSDCAAKFKKKKGFPLPS